MSNIIDNKLYPMYYINLEKRIIRRNEIENQILKYKLNITRFPAIDGCQIKINHKYLKRGAYGCFMSHYKLWEKIKDSHTPYIIFEDDIIFCDQFSYKLKNIILESSSLEYDIILLGHNWCTQKIKLSKNISNIGLFYGMQGYILTPNAANKLYNKFIDHSNWIKPLDVILGEININKEIKILATTEKLITLSKYAGGSDTNRN